MGDKHFLTRQYNVGNLAMTAPEAVLLGSSCREHLLHDRPAGRCSLTCAHTEVGVDENVRSEFSSFPALGACPSATGTCRILKYWLRGSPLFQYIETSRTLFKNAMCIHIYLFCFRRRLQLEAPLPDGGGTCPRLRCSRRCWPAHRLRRCSGEHPCTCRVSSLYISYWQTLPVSSLECSPSTASVSIDDRYEGNIVDCWGLKCVNLSRGYRVQPCHEHKQCHPDLQKTPMPTIEGSLGTEII